MKRLFYIISIALLFVGVAYCQSLDKISRKCTNLSLFGNILVQANGNIVHNPCPSDSSIFNRHVSFRNNNTDYYSYGYTFDIIGNYNGTGERTNFYNEFNIDTASANGVYSNVSTTLNIPTTINFLAAIGLSTGVQKTSSNNIHDIQGLQSNVTVTAGTIQSGAYGLTAGVNITGGSPHGDIADISIGSSNVSNVTARSYSTLWIKQPTLTNSTITDGAFAIRVDKLLRTPVFTVDLDGQIKIVNPITPASATATCSQGSIVWDANFIYVCVATDTWKRTAISSW